MNGFKRVAFMLFCFVALFSLNAQEDSSRGYIVKVGEQAPDFVMTLDNGERVKLSDLRGKGVMLQFTLKMQLRVQMHKS